MELYTMRYVIALAEYENFSLAAQACHIGQSALSQQIAKLEKELGVALFHRHPRGATPTEACEEFVRRARKILQLSDALDSEMSLFAGLHRGTLNLGIITSLQCIDFGGLLSSFCEKYPGISVNTVQSGTHRLLQQLEQAPFRYACRHQLSQAGRRYLPACRSGSPSIGKFPRGQSDPAEGYSLHLP